MKRSYHKSRLKLTPATPIRAPKPHLSRVTNAISSQTLDFDKEVANFREDKNAKQVAGLAALDSGLIKFLLYGGAMGGGKSYFLRWAAVRILIKLFQDKRMRHVPVMLACEDYPTLKDRQLAKIAAEFPAWMGQSYTDHKDYGRAYILHEGYGGGVLCFRNLDDPSKYMSAEFAAILVDELTKNLYGMFTDLKTRLRWPGLKDIECPFIGGTNPGDIGHSWVKQLWIDRNFPPEWIKPIDYRSQFAFIRSKADDNPYLDQTYWDSLNALPIMKRKAYREGDWNIFAGQAFPEVTRETHEYHPVGPRPPKGTWLSMAMDWGFGKPFSIGWYHTDADGRLYRFHEWYGWGGTPDTGLRLPDSEIAKGIIEREKAWGIFEEMQESIRVLSPDCFQKKPNYKGGGQGPSTAEEFLRAGLKGLHPGDPDRKLKIRQFRERIKVPEPDNGNARMPMLLVADECDQFFRTVPTLVNDKINVEDVDTDGEDHAYDEIALMCMARPTATAPVLEVKPVRPPANATEVAGLELKNIWQEVQDQNEAEFPW